MACAGVREGRCAGRLHIFIQGFSSDSMSSLKQAKRYSAKVNAHHASAKRLAKAAKLRAKAAKLREQVARHDAKIRALQKRIAELERRANQLVGQPPP